MLVVSKFKSFFPCERANLYLQVGGSPATQQIASLSGGQKARVAMAVLASTYHHSSLIGRHRGVGGRGGDIKKLLGFLVCLFVAFLQDTSFQVKTRTMGDVSFYS